MAEHGGGKSTHTDPPACAQSDTHSTRPHCIPISFFFFPGRSVALWLATLGQRWRAEAADRMPTATGDIREIVGQPVFVPLYRLFVVYGKVCG